MDDDFFNDPVPTQPSNAAHSHPVQHDNEDEFGGNLRLTQRPSTSRHRFLSTGPAAATNSSGATQLSKVRRQSTPKPLTKSENRRTRSKENCDKNLYMCRLLRMQNTRRSRGEGKKGKGS